jgi:hypothetical protein
LSNSGLMAINAARRLSFNSGRVAVMLR